MVKVLSVLAAVAIAAGAAALVAPGVSAQPTAPRAARVVDVMGSGGRIGVSIRDVEAGKSGPGAPAAGVLVEDVVEEGPAARAGLRKGDVVVEFDGERVRSARQFARLVQETPAGRSVGVAVLRDGQRTTLQIEVGEGGRFGVEGFEHFAELGRAMAERVRPVVPVPPTPPAPPAPPAGWFDERFGRSGGGRLGVSVAALSPQLADYFGVKEGVLVTAVTERSAGADAGLKAGDVIRSVNGAAIDDPAELRRRTAALGSGEEFTIEVTRDRKALTLKGKADAAERRRVTRTVVL